jgi:hypothetical protein
MSLMEEILQQLRDVAGRLPADERPVFGNGVSAQAIAAIESSMRATLPADYAEFLRICGEVRAMDVWNGYWIGGAALIDAKGGGNGIPAWLAGDKGPVAAVPVGTDGGGNAFLMSVASGTIWKWNHETKDEQIVGPDFTGFLKRVLQDWEHYVSGEPWTYLSG